MATIPLKQALEGEHIVGVMPTIAPYVDNAGWRKRPYLFTGRTLTKDALESEQGERAGRIALRGQMVYPGIIRGLDVRIEQSTISGIRIDDDYSNGRRDTLWLHIGPGSGIAASGETVTIPRAQRVRLSNVPVVYEKELGGKPFSIESVTKKAIPAGLFGIDVEKPRLDDLVSKAEGLNVKEGAQLIHARSKRAAILVLVPAAIERQAGGEQTDPCVIEPENYAFLDQQRVDGCIPTLFVLDIDFDEPRFSALSSLRNELAYWIFERERLKVDGTWMPWEEVGVPIALLGLWPIPLGGWNVFVDRASVVRPGGAPRTRSRVLSAQPDFLLRQARIQQFSEQMVDFDLENDTAGDKTEKTFHFLPPVGVLPKRVFDCVTWQPRFFPDHFVVDAVPVPIEQLDSITLQSASLRPLETTKAEYVRILVPVPAKLFEPSLLEKESIDPAFYAAIRESYERLGEWHGRKHDVKHKLGLLLDAESGYVKGRFSEADPEAIPGEEAFAPFPGTPFVPPEDDFGIENEQAQAFSSLMRQYFGQPEKLVESEKELVTSIPSVTLSANGMVDMIWRGADRKAWHRSYDGRTFSAATAVFDAGKCLNAPVIFALPNGQVHVFAVGVSRKMLHRIGTYSAKGVMVWGAVAEIAENCASVPAVASRGGNRIDLVFKHIDGTLEAKTREFGGGNTSQWSTIELKELRRTTPDPEDMGRVLSAPVAVSSRQGRLDVFARHSDGVTYYSWYEGNQASYWQPISANSKWVNVVVSGQGRMEFFGTVPREGLYHRSFFNGTWSAVKHIHGPVNLTPAVVAWPSGIMEIFARGKDASLLYNRFNGKDWSGWLSLSGHLRMPPVVLRHKKGRLDVFIRGANNTLLFRPNIVSDPWMIANWQGIQGLLATIVAKKAHADEVLDGLFTRLQSEIHKVRQLMLGTVTSSRLSVSPVMASVLPSETRIAKKNEVGDYTKRLGKKSIWSPIPVSVAQEVDEASPIKDIAVRLAKPPSPEVWQAAKLTKHDVIETVVDMLGQLDIDASEITIPRVIFKRKATQTTVEPVQPGSSPRASGTVGTAPVGVEAAQYVSKQIKLGELVSGSASWQKTVLKKVLEAPEPDSSVADEAFYFSDAIKILEDTVKFLRQVEQRVDELDKVIAACEKALSNIGKEKQAVNARMLVIDHEIAEARQDVGVAKALFAEETVRVEAINQRRAQVLRDHVPYYVFQRPRERDFCLDTPARLLDPGETPDILPDVLASTAAAPAELTPLVELLRTVPLSWLNVGRILVRKLDRLEDMQETLSRAKISAQQAAWATLPRALERPGSKMAEGLSRILSAQRSVLELRRTALQTMDVQAEQRKSYLELSERVLGHINLAHLMEAFNARSVAAKQAAIEIERMTRVLAALYERFGSIAPILRLQWAESMSQYDRPVYLRNLGNLPGFSQVEVLQRRHMQTLVDWLFTRFVSTESEAMALANDLVRGCMLLSAHAPVDEIVSGHLPKPVTAVVGGKIDLAVDASKIRMGMHVLIQASGHVVQAAVEDISQGTVRARVFSSTAQSVNLPEKTSVRFSDPERGRGIQLPTPWEKR